MAAVFGGNPALLYEIFLDPDADQFLRSRMCEALAMVTLRGDLDRARAGRILRDAFMEMKPQAENFVWYGWQSAIAMLGLSDLKTLVKKAFDRGFIDRYILKFEHFEQDLRRSFERVGEPWRPMITSTPCSAKPSTSYRDGTALATNTARTKSGIDDR